MDECWLPLLDLQVSDFWFRDVYENGFGINWNEGWWHHQSPPALMFFDCGPNSKSFIGDRSNRQHSIRVGTNFIILIMRMDVESIDFVFLWLNSELWTLNLLVWNCNWFLYVLAKKKSLPPERFELPTSALLKPRSTNWAKGAAMYVRSGAYGSEVKQVWETVGVYSNVNLKVLLLQKTKMDR